MEVTFYDSFEEMAKAEEQAREQADSQVKEWQQAIKPGDFYARVWEDILIIGEILENVEGEGLESYRFTKSYSCAVPEGELGDIHVSVVESLLSREVFDSILAFIQGR